MMNSRWFCLGRGGNQNHRAYSQFVGIGEMVELLQGRHRGVELAGDAGKGVPFLHCVRFAASHGDRPRGFGRSGRQWDFQLLPHRKGRGITDVIDSRQCLNRGVVTLGDAVQRIPFFDHVGCKSGGGRCRRTGRRPDRTPSWG